MLPTSPSDIDGVIKMGTEKPQSPPQRKIPLSRSLNIGEALATQHTDPTTDTSTTGDSDIDDVFGYGNEERGNTKRSSSLVSLERTPHVVKTRTRSTLSTSKPIVASEIKNEKAFVVDLDIQDIDTVLKVSRYHRRTSKQADESRRESGQSNTQSVTSQGSDPSDVSETKKSYSTGTNNPVNDIAPLLTSKNNILKKALVYTSGENRPHVVSDYGTDIDSLMSGNLKPVRSMTALKSLSEIESSQKKRSRSQTVIARITQKEDKNLQKSRLFNSALLATPTSCSPDIDSILDISNLSEDMVGLSIKSVDTIEQPKSLHTDADFFMQVWEKSANGSKEYREVLDKPDYKMDPRRAANAVHNIDTTAVDIDSSMKTSENRPPKFPTSGSGCSGFKTGKENDGENKKGSDIKQSVKVVDVTSKRTEYDAMDFDQVVNYAAYQGPRTIASKLVGRTRVRAKSELPSKSRM